MDHDGRKKISFFFFFLFCHLIYVTNYLCFLDSCLMSSQSLKREKVGSTTADLFFHNGVAWKYSRINPNQTANLLHWRLIKVFQIIMKWSLYKYQNCKELFHFRIYQVSSFSVSYNGKKCITFVSNYDGVSVGRSSW